jgi:ribosomal-protein-alanine N-acetyltransferase
MKTMTVLQTARLTLRRWIAADREPFARMNRDPAVMQFMPALLSTEESNGLVDRIEAHFEQHGFGLWAAELRDTARFVGFIGLAVPRFQAEFMPAVEIGWRLDKDVWRQGLATEGAREVVRHAFEDLELASVVSFTVPANLASRRVMEKLGMTHDSNDDFDHPLLPEGHRLRRHALYRLMQSEGC